MNTLHYTVALDCGGYARISIRRIENGRFRAFYAAPTQWGCDFAMPTEGLALQRALAMLGVTRD